MRVHRLSIVNTRFSPIGTCLAGALQGFHLIARRCDMRTDKNWRLLGQGLAVLILTAALAACGGSSDASSSGSSAASGAGVSPSVSGSSTSSSSSGAVSPVVSTTSSSSLAAAKSTGGSSSSGSSSGATPSAGGEGANSAQVSATPSAPAPVATIQLPQITAPSASPTATTYYVSASTGLTTNNGLMPSTPFAHISEATNNPALNGGDVIMVIPGTYDETVRLSVSGTPTGYTTLMAMPGQGLAGLACHSSL